MRRIKKPKGDTPGQMMLFGKNAQKIALAGKKPVPRKGLSLAERRATKARAFGLARQAYAILRSPQYFSDKSLAQYRRRAGQFIGAYQKNRATFSQAQSVVGMITGLFDRLGVKYKP